MKKIILVILTALMLTIPAISIADIPSTMEEIIVDDKTWVSFYGSHPGEEPILNVLESSSENMIIDVKLSGFWVSDIVIDGDIYQEISIPGHSTTMEIGEPAIPIIRSLVAIPNNCNIETSYSIDNQIILEDYYLTVFEEPLTDNTLYHSRTKPSNTVSIKPDFVTQIIEPGIWRDINIATVEIAPMIYKYSDHTLTISPQMTIELNFISNNGGNPKYTDKPISSRFDKLYSNHLINYNLLELNVQSCNNPGVRYLIISHPDFVSAIQSLADWHYQEGFETEVLSLSTSDYMDVKDEIVTRFNQGDLEYVLLVGDTNFIPIAVWEGFYSDYFYACITGAPDYYADIAVGRISVTNSTQASNQVTKILNYEQDPPLDSWLNKIILVAHKQDAPGKYVGCKEDIRNDIIPQPPYMVDTAYGHQPTGTNDHVSSAINEGRNIVNYRGHGSNTQWTGWSYTNEYWEISDVNALTNENRTPIVFNIACQNHYLLTDCLGEAFMNKYPGGAVASLGATDPSYTIPNHDYDKELFRQFTMYDEYRIGWMANAAATLIINDHGSMGLDNAQMYLWLGDPATEVWTGIPGTLSVDYPPTISYGPSIVPVTVESDNDPVEGALVCVMQPDGCYASGYTDTNGLVELEVVVVNPDEATLTVSAHDYLPFITQVQIGNSYPPLKPTVNGPSAGRPEKDYEFKAITTDPEEDQILYKFDWGDDTVSDWLGPYNSGQEITVSHAWPIAGNYSIKVRAKDINDSISYWSDPCTIQIVLPILEIGSIKGGFLKITSKILNQGIAEADDINWKISLDGGFILLGKVSNDTIITIPAGGEHNISSKQIIGFGKTRVTMRVDFPEGTEERKQGGFLYLFYIHVNPGGS
jgi:hypothetical protein